MAPRAAKSPKPVAAWTYGTGAIPPFAGLWFAGLVGVAHLFLLPGAVAWGAYYLTTGHPTLQLCALALAACYVATLFDGAQYDARRRWPGFVSPWTRCHHYFPVKTLMWNGKTFTAMPEVAHYSVFSEERSYIFAASPHGPVPVGAAVLGPQLARWPSLAQRTRTGVASVCFYIPFVRDFYLWFGSIDAGRRTLRKALTDGLNVIILPGGIKEQLLVCGPLEDRVVLKNRKGVAALSIETGAWIVPVYIFGERRAYSVNAGVFHDISAALKRYCGIGLPFVRGRWWTLTPFAVPITIVVGAPIEPGRKASGNEATVMRIRLVRWTRLTRQL